MFSCIIFKICEKGGKKMVFEKVQDIIVDGLGIEKEKITMESSLSDDLGADSLDAVELIMAIEEEFDISIEDEDAQTLQTVGQIVEYIEKKM